MRRCRSVRMARRSTWPFLGKGFQENVAGYRGWGGGVVQAVACLWLVRTGLAHEPLRVALTTGSVAIAFALLWLLKGVDAGLERQINSIPSNRLHVTSRTGLGGQLPLASLYALDDVPGVSHVTPLGYHNARYGGSREHVFIIAVDIEPYLSVAWDLRIEPDTVRAFVDTPGAAIAGADLSERFGWNPGDRVVVDPVVGAPGEGWSFELVGTWDAGSSAGESNWLLVSFAHVDQSLPEGMQGLVDAFAVLVDDSSSVDAVAAAIDDGFLNSAAPTLTARTRDVSMSGRHPKQVRLVANAIVGASLFAILFCTAGVMAQSARDRHHEFALMKSLGFGNGTLVLGIFGESASICGVGALIALVPAALVDAGELLGRYGAVVYPPPLTLYPFGFGLAMLLTAVSACLPAWRVALLSPAEVAR